MPKKRTNFIAFLQKMNPSEIFINIRQLYFHTNYFLFFQIFLESKIAKARQPAMAMAQPTIFGTGKVSPTVKKYRATNMTTLFRVLPTAVGTAPAQYRMKNVCIPKYCMYLDINIIVPRDDRTIFCTSLQMKKHIPHTNKLMWKDCWSGRFWQRLNITSVF